MALDSYANLQDALQGLLQPTSDVTARFPDCITLFEATANRRLRARPQVTTTTLTPSAGAATLPTDFLQVVRVTWTGDPYHELEYVAPSYLQAAFPVSISTDSPTNTPTIYTIEGESLLIRPKDTTSIQLVYFAKVPALSVTNTSNWLLVSHPDIYLFGAALEAELFGVNDERFPLWKSRVDETVDELNKLAMRSRGVGGMRVMGPTP